MRTKQTSTPMDVCNLIAHETVALLEALDDSAIPPAMEMRNSLALYASANALDDAVVPHLAWIDEEIQRLKQTAGSGQLPVHLVPTEQLVRTVGLGMQIKAVRELFRSAVQMESTADRTALREMANMVTDLCGIDDILEANGKDAVRTMEKVWELFREATEAEDPEHRQKALNDADAYIEELSGQLTVEGEGNGPLLTSETLQAEIEDVTKALGIGAYHMELG